MACSNGRIPRLAHGVPRLGGALWLVCAWLVTVATSVEAQQIVQSTKACTRCHFPSAGEIGIAAPAAGVAPPLCYQEEAATWEQQDKHRQSTFLLLNDQNRPLTNRILGFDVADVLSFQLASRSFRSLTSGKTVAVDSVSSVKVRADADAEKTIVVRQCLACHAPIDEPTFEDPTVSSLEFGVSCQACHGVGTDYLAPHQDGLRMWRVLDPSVKSRTFGMTDLRNPFERAQVCASCHVGSMREEWGPGTSPGRRFVRHEWYANGHPPLPSLEYVTFASQMPAHWRTIQEKSAESPPFQFLAPSGAAEADRAALRRLQTAFHQQYLAPKNVPLEALRDSYLTANRQSYPSEDPAGLMDDQPRSRDALVASLAVLAQYALVLKNCPPEWERDFAYYDCQACHHELRATFPSDARVRRATTPGRPPAAFWTRTLARQAAATVASRLGNELLGPAESLQGGRAWSDELDRAIGQLDEAFTARPFGDWDAIRGAASRVETACQALGNGLAARPFPRAAAEELLARLAHPKGDEDRDYHAARLSAWAIRETLKDLAGVPYRNYALELKVPRLPVRDVPPRVMVALGAKEDVKVPADDPRVMRRIDGLFGADPWWGPLRLRLPAGQQETILGHLPESLAAISQYDPQFFRESLVPIQRQYPLPPTSPRPPE